MGQFFELFDLLDITGNIRPLVDSLGLFVFAWVCGPEIIRGQLNTIFIFVFACQIF